jgi:hypothetical protein
MGWDAGVVTMRAGLIYVVMRCDGCPECTIWDRMMLDGMLV